MRSMTAWRHPPLNDLAPKEYLQKLGSLLVAGCLLIVSGVNVAARPLVTNQPPVAFFTNVASWLLQSELKQSLNRIQIYPTNQYTPALHRLLQLTANLHDAASDRSLGFTNPSPLPPPTFPAVFRPLFELPTLATRCIS